jgi:hypothetical protein
MMLRFSRLEAAVADEVDLVALQFQVAAPGYGEHLHGSDHEAVGLGCQGNGGGQFDFKDRGQGALMISGQGKGAGRK